MIISHLKTDLAILGKNHMYKGFGIPFEPEGLLSTIPSICTVIIGYFTGELVAKGSASGKTVLKLLLIGAGTTGLGYLWGMIFPINKALWTSSYVLYSGGLAMIVLVCYLPDCRCIEIHNVGDILYWFLEPMHCLHLPWQEYGPN